MKYIDWNQMSELGLIERINTEILHPLGLALSRDPDTGVSHEIFVAEDGKWCYSNDRNSTILTDDEVKHKLAEFVNENKLKTLKVNGA